MMTIFSGRFVKLMAVAALPLFFTSLTHAQATRTWVSGVGDDVNPCSRTAPCKTFAGAISKTAAGGEISVLDPGGFGAITITKSITINGDGTTASILSAGTNGVNVNAGPSDVVILRNISINGAGTGINGIVFNTGGKLHVENVKVYGVTGHGILFQPSAASSLFVGNSSFRNNTGGALYIIPTGTGTATAALNGVTMDNNGRGLRAEDGSKVVVSNSSASGNVANGFVALAVSRPVELSIDNSVSSLNGAAGVYSGALATVKISNVTATGNNVGLQTVGGGAIISFKNNRVLGNVSSDGAPTSSPGEI
jgi:hypothetical protein